MIRRKGQPDGGELHHTSGWGKLEGTDVGAAGAVTVAIFGHGSAIEDG
jgi:hypothetical protein